MKRTLHVIVDASGSMAEMGKIHLQRNLCRYVAQLRSIDQEKYAALEIHFFQWVQDISEIYLQKDGDIPEFNAEGIVDLHVLSEFLSQNANGEERWTGIVLSDGNFDREEYSQFIKWKQNNGDLTLHTVAVGADADLLKLEKISTNNMVMLSENIASAIDITLFGPANQPAAPVSIAEIKLSESAKSEEPAEDWDA